MLFSTVRPTSTLTTYATKLPCSSAQATGFAQADAALPPLYCLVVDHSSTACLSLRDSLARLPCLLAVGSCSTPTETLAFLREYPVDILLLHALMPLHTGLELLQLLLHHLPRLPLLVFTNHNVVPAAINNAPCPATFFSFLNKAFVTATRANTTLVAAIQSLAVPDSVTFSLPNAPVLTPVHFAELCHLDLAGTTYVSIVVKQLATSSASVARPWAHCGNATTLAT